jgi:hypothetical protein
MLHLLRIFVFHLFAQNPNGVAGLPFGRGFLCRKTTGELACALRNPQLGNFTRPIPRTIPPFYHSLARFFLLLHNSLMSYFIPTSPSFVVRNNALAGTATAFAVVRRDLPRGEVSNHAAAPGGVLAQQAGAADIRGSVIARDPSGSRVRRVRGVGGRAIGRVHGGRTSGRGRGRVSGRGVSNAIAEEEVVEDKEVEVEVEEENSNIWRVRRNH